MTAYYNIDPDTLLIDNDTAKAAGAAQAEIYQAAEPYHHACIDNFLPEALLENVLNELETLPAPEEGYSRAQENLKFSYIPERLPAYTKNLFYAFNSRPFILFLEQMTGIKGLIPDPYFMGAGIHKTLNGGHLDIHADFNLHGPMQVERRLNVLIYLNRDWKEEYGGSFEVWDKEMTRKMNSFVPKFNRMVCFSTGSDTFHGNPEPVNHPEGEARQSIALYYYTATWDATRKEHTTLFKPRPGSKDKADRLVARRALMQDILPPIVYRKLAGPLSRIGF
ncbi:2OG-Fe(II) oxygenase [uncultured Tateyamaria sp.]|uniref:2OG-Fe(II) oxygenase n=1 Tax=uncultured Tateyamaria sp. TaxID=455651 RepID=UPI002626B281|nr:2OG-Fe(II) oxygenase [uncultured Tateyamaria sp.]